MKNTAALALMFASAAAFAGSSTYRYTEGDGSLLLYVSEESGDIAVEITTTGNNWICTTEELVPCSLEKEGLKCFIEEGYDPIAIAFKGDDVEVTSFPHDLLCGLNGYALGRYKYEGSE